MTQPQGISGISMPTTESVSTTSAAPDSSVLNVAEARARRDAIVADKTQGAKIMAGDSALRSELHSLN